MSDVDDQNSDDSDYFNPKSMIGSYVSYISSNGNSTNDGKSCGKSNTMSSREDKEVNREVNRKTANFGKNGEG